MNPSAWLDSSGPRVALGVLEDLARMAPEDRELITAVLAGRTSLGEGRRALALIRLAKALELGSLRVLRLERILSANPETLA